VALGTALAEPEVSPAPPEPPATVVHCDAAHLDEPIPSGLLSRMATCSRNWEDEVFGTHTVELRPWGMTGAIGGTIRS